MGVSAATLFVVGQAGAADYLAPLWRRWLQSGTSVSWHIVAHPAALLQIERLGLNGRLPLLDAWDSEKLQDELRQRQFDRLVCSASREPMEAAALTWATKNGIPSLHLLDALYGFSWRSDLRAGMMAVIDDQACSDAAEEGLPQERLVVAGHPAWEAIAPMDDAPLGNWLFLDQPIATVRPDLGYTEQDAWGMIQDAARLQPQAFQRLIYAPHPARGPKAGLPEGSLSLAETMTLQQGLHQCGTIAGVYSGGMVEAFLGGRRVVSLLPRSGEVLCPLARRGLSPLYRSAAELADAAMVAMCDNRALRASLHGSLDRLDAIIRSLA